MATTPNNSAAQRRITVTLDNDLCSQIDFLRSDNDHSFEQEVVISLKFGIENRSYRKGYMQRRNANLKQLPRQLSAATAKIASLEQQLQQLKKQQ